MHFSPNCLSLFSCSSLNFFKRITLNSLSDGSQISISLGEFIGALFMVFFAGVMFPWFFMVFVYLCSYLLIWVSSLLFQTLQVHFSQSAQCLWTGQLVTPVGKWSLLSGSLVEQGHCLSSKVGGGSTAGWAPCSSGASEWSPWSEEAPGCVLLCASSWAQQSSMVRRISVCVPWQSNANGWVTWFGRVSAGLHHCSWLGGGLGWAACLGEAASCVQQLVRAVCWILLLDAAVG